MEPEPNQTQVAEIGDHPENGNDIDLAPINSSNWSAHVRAARADRKTTAPLRAVHSEPVWNDIPTELTSCARWVLRQGKIPKQSSGAAASSTDPETWTTFGAARTAYLAGGFDGVGFVLNGDGLVCFDFDHCIDVNGQITDPKVAAFVERLGSYTEVSTSGDGLHVFVLGKLPPEGRKKGPFEVYDDKRVMIVTGRRLADAPATVNECQEAIDSIHAEIFAEPARAPQREAAIQPARADAEILTKARAASNSVKLEALLAGDCSGYPSNSEADAALAFMLAFYTQDDMQIERIMRDSKLRRDKWDRKGDDYLARTIKRALAATTKNYAWPETKPVTKPPTNDQERSALGTLTLPLTKFLSFDAPPRLMLLDPILRQKDLVEIYSQRGIGKTFVGLGMANAIACGGSMLHFNAPKPSKVLYIDGEMQAADMQDRLRAIMTGAGGKVPDDEFFRILSPELQERTIPNLAKPEGQKLFDDEVIQDAEVIFFDNLSSLFRGGVENDSDSWTDPQAWFLELRRRGLTVVFMHHAGKGGAQRGTSAREDVLDTVINLRHPKDYQPEQGLRFELHFEKFRGMHGAAVMPFEVKLTVTKSGDISRATWSEQTIEDAQIAFMAELLAQTDSSGKRMSVTAASKEMGISRATAYRLSLKIDASTSGEIKRVKF